MKSLINGDRLLFELSEKPALAAATQSTRARSRGAFPTSKHSFRRPALLRRFAFPNERPTLSPGGIPGPQPRHAAVRRQAARGGRGGTAGWGTAARGGLGGTHAPAQGERSTSDRTRAC